MLLSSVLLVFLVGSISAAPVVEDDWTDIVKAGADVVSGVAKVVEDGFKIAGDISGKREVEDDWTAIVKAGAEVLTGVATVLEDTVKIAGHFGKREVQDDLLTDLTVGAGDLLNIAKDIESIVHTIFTGETGTKAGVGENEQVYKLTGSAAVGRHLLYERYDVIKAPWDKVWSESEETGNAYVDKIKLGERLWKSIDYARESQTNF